MVEDDPVCETLAEKYFIYLPFQYSAQNRVCINHLHKLFANAKQFD